MQELLRSRADSLGLGLPFSGGFCLFRVKLEVPEVLDFDLEWFLRNLVMLTS